MRQRRRAAHGEGAFDPSVVKQGVMIENFEIEAILRRMALKEERTASVGPIEEDSLVG